MRVQTIVQPCVWTFSTLWFCSIKTSYYLHYQLGHVVHMELSVISVTKRNGGQVLEFLVGNI
jgi:hypothetical protein